MFITIIVMASIIVLMIGINALYVAGEFAIVSARKTRIEQAAAEGNRLAKILLPIVQDTHRLDNFIAASQVGITLSSIALGIYGQQQIAPLLTPVLAGLPFLSSEAAAAGISATLVLIFLTGLQVILGELVPKSIAIQYPERVALLTALPMRWSADIILRPLIIVLNGSGALLMKILKIRHEGGHQHIHSPEEIKFLIQQSHQGGLLDEEEHMMLDNAFRFGEMKAGEIVVPRTRMVAASINTPVNEILKLAAESDYTRIPIYEDDIDHIIGFVHLKELFRLSYEGRENTVRGILRKVAFVPETTRIDDVWETLNREQCNLAIVFDEYGGTAGMITREDLLEEIFGEVQDEFDDAAVLLLVKLSETEFRVRGNTPLVYVNDQLSLDLPADDAYTIGGLVINALGRLPEVGDTVTIQAVRLKVQAVTDKVVGELVLTLPQAANPASQEKAEE